MTTVRLSFHLSLHTDFYPSVPRIIGPFFHRFVPNGPQDAIYVTPDGDPHEIRIWFRRSARLENDFLQWDQNGSQFDETIMRRQAKLEGGPLFGEMQVDVSEEEMASLLRSPKRLNDSFGQDVGDDPAYVSLGKRVIKVLQPRVANFISTLRNQYGQYWLEELPAWDSRRNTLGTYCSSVLSLAWWNEDKQEWYRFLPTNSGSTIAFRRPPGRGYAEYLSEEDWRRLQRTRCLIDVSTEVQLLGSATRAIDSNEFRHAFIEAMSALELIIARRLAAHGEMTKRAVQSFLDHERQNAQVAVVLLIERVDCNEIEEVLRALKVRNQVAHEGYLPSANEVVALRSVMNTIRRLAGLEDLKCPVLESGNQLTPP